MEKNRVGGFLSKLDKSLSVGVICVCVFCLSVGMIIGGMIHQGTPTNMKEGTTRFNWVQCTGPRHAVLGLRGEEPRYYHLPKDCVCPPEDAHFTYVIVNEDDNTCFWGPVFGSRIE